MWHTLANYDFVSNVLKQARKRTHIKGHDVPEIAESHNAARVGQSLRNLESHEHKRSHEIKGTIPHDYPEQRFRHSPTQRAPPVALVDSEDEHSAVVCEEAFPRRREAYQNQASVGKGEFVVHHADARIMDPLVASRWQEGIRGASQVIWSDTAH